jgi:hypothetical protein
VQLKNITLTLFIFLAAIVLTASANATPVTYCLSGAVFNDGATASGCFTYDAVTNTYTNVNITTTTNPAGPPRTGAIYTVVSNGFPPNPGGFLMVTSTAANQTGLPGFALFFVPDLGTPGVSSFDLVAGGSQEADCGDAACSFPAGVMRFLVSGVAIAIVDQTYQLRYLANLNVGDSYIDLTNAGTLNGFDPAGRICVNVYTFDPAEEMISCCACPVTPNGLNSLSARNDLISNTLTPGVPTSVTVKLLASLPLPGNTCNASSPNAANLVRGMRAWATTLHLNTAILPAPGKYQTTETPFSFVELSATELAKLTSFCGFIQSNGSGFGICKSCRFGALGSASK